jgi:hypothetical protein
MALRVITQAVNYVSGEFPYDKLPKRLIALMMIASEVNCS